MSPCRMCVGGTALVVAVQHICLPARDLMCSFNGRPLLLLLPLLLGR